MFTKVHCKQGLEKPVVSKLYIYHYPKKRKTVSSKDGMVDVTELTMSDLGNGDQDSDDETNLML